MVIHIYICCFLITATLIKKYTQAGTIAAHGGLDPYDNNKWEKRADNWSKREVKKWIDKF